jgi:hypothetical protein
MLHFGTCSYNRTLDVTRGLQQSQAGPKEARSCTSHLQDAVSSTSTDIGHASIGHALVEYIHRYWTCQYWTCAGRVHPPILDMPVLDMRWSSTSTDIGHASIGHALVEYIHRLYQLVQRRYGTSTDCTNWYSDGTVHPPIVPTCRLWYSDGTVHPPSWQSHGPVGRDRKDNDTFRRGWS